jgi:hypothetical protein
MVSLLRIQTLFLISYDKSQQGAVHRIEKSEMQFIM